MQPTTMSDLSVRPSDGRPLGLPQDRPALRIPRRVTAAAPGWSTSADVIVVGSGIAGLSCALLLRRRVERVLLVTKTVLSEGSTQWAQGGIAAALAPEDSPEDHLHDTLVAGAGVCDVDAVRVLVTEGAQRVRELVALGAEFDRTAAGEISEISRALIAALQRVVDDPGIEVVEQAMVVDLLQDPDERVVGVTLHVLGEGQVDGVGAAYGRAVVLATGGLGQIYSSTTNLSVATGDGMAAALRAGAVMRDVEFVQFHPTVLWLGEGSHGQQPLISEALRGEGAFLVDADGDRFMTGLHPLADLAPRDVVARAIVARMRETGTDHVFLDARHLGAAFLAKRFPSIMASCRSLGFDPATDLLPVAPAQHYASGGVHTDLAGRSSLRGLYACGETSCTGVHGANRLASNSLLEGLVFAHRIADDITERLGGGGLPAASYPVVPVGDSADTALLASDRRIDVQHAMSAGSGTVRTAASTRATAGALAALADAAGHAEPGPQSWETTNLLHLGQLLTTMAHVREETRGGHLRTDFPERDEVTWRGNTSVLRAGDGSTDLTFADASPPAAARETSDPTVAEAADPIKENA